MFRAAWNIFGFVLAGAGGFSLIDVEQGWVFATLAFACAIMLSSGIFASWLLVLQIRDYLTSTWREHKMRVRWRNCRPARNPVRSRLTGGGVGMDGSGSRTHRWLR